MKSYSADDKYMNPQTYDLQEDGLVFAENSQPHIFLTHQSAALAKGRLDRAGFATWIILDPRDPTMQNYLVVIV